MPYLKPGGYYFVRYDDWIIDPAPYIYVIYSDRQITTAFNLHYLPQIRFRLPIESYKRVNEKVWGQAYDNMIKAGMFKGFLRVLEESSQAQLSRSRYKQLVNLVERRHKWAMQSYRRYHTPKLRLRYEDTSEYAKSPTEKK